MISARRTDVPALRKLSGSVPLKRIGTVGGSEIAVGAARIALADALDLYEGALPRIMEGGA